MLKTIALLNIFEGSSKEQSLISNLIILLHYTCLCHFW